MDTLILGKNLSDFVPPLENSTTRITILAVKDKTDCAVNLYADAGMFR